MQIPDRIAQLELSAVARIQIEAAASGWNDIISLAGGEPTFDPPAEVAQGFGEVVAGGFNKYSPFAGYATLLELIASKLRAVNGIDVPPAQIFCVPGGAAALYVSVLALTDERDEVLIQDPCWEHYPQIVRLAGATPVRFRMVDDGSGHFAPDLEHLRSVLSPRTRAILLNTPLNPCGSVLREAEIAELAALAETEDLALICDEEYETYVYGDARHVSPAAVWPQAVTLHSFSKSFALTGIRLAYVSGPAKAIEAIRRVSLYTFMFAPSPSQHAATRLLEGDYLAYLDTVRADYGRRARRLQRALDELPAVRCEMPEGGLYVLPDFTTFGLDGWEATRRLYEDVHVLSVPGEAAGEQTAGRVRLFYGVVPEVLDEAIGRIRRAVEAWEPAEAAAAAAVR